MEILELKNIYENYKVIIRDINRRLSKDRKGKLATKENMSILISEYILEDCKEVIKLISENNKRRYVYNIIRTMCESIIEYKYFMNNENLIGEYFGEKIPEIGEKNTNKTSFYYIYKEYGQNRFECFNGQKNVWEMARNIKEIKNTDNEICLYYIFSMMSEKVHNAYFGAIMHDIYELNEENDNELEEDLKSYQSYMCTIIITLLNKFYKTLSNV